MSTLDRTRDYAEIYGIAEDGAAFTQDGKRFSGTGDELVQDVQESSTPANKRGRKPKVETDIA
jgi:hypothetical protein